MAGTYRIFGNELSPYSIKVRSFFRYKRIPHEWIVRNASNEEEFRKHAKLPLIPLVITPDGRGLQDSTPILETLEKIHPEPPLQPADPTLAFLSALIEEYADEWGNKPMFHFRWTYEADQQAAGERLAKSMMPNLGDAEIAGAVEMIKGRMVPRLRLVGSAPETLEAIEGSFRRQLAILEPHLARRPYLFGGRPALADFGLGGQMYQLLDRSDPSGDRPPRSAERRRVGGAHARAARRGRVRALERAPGGLLPLLRDEVAAVFLPWSDANARAIAAGQTSFSLELGGRPFGQETQKYHAKSLAVLRERYARVPDRSALDPILDESGRLAGLRA